MNRQIKQLLGIGIGIFVVIPLAVWGVYSLISLRHAGEVQINITVVPSDATVSVGGNTLTGKSSVYLKPGDYTVTISKDGFETDTQDITVLSDDDNSSDSSQASIISALNPKSDTAKTWYNDNQDAYYELEKIAGSEASASGEAFIDKFPITGFLPVQKATYSIGYKRTEDQKGIIVTIKAYEGYREAALQKIRDLGFDPSDFTIQFNNYENPFNE